MCPVHLARHKRPKQASLLWCPRSVCNCTTACTTITCNGPALVMPCARMAAVADCVSAALCLTQLPQSACRHSMNCRDRPRPHASVCLYREGPAGGVKALIATTSSGPGDSTSHALSTTPPPSVCIRGHDPKTFAKVDSEPSLRWAASTGACQHSPAPLPVDGQHPSSEPLSSEIFQKMLLHVPVNVGIIVSCPLWPRTSCLRCSPYLALEGTSRKGPRHRPQRRPRQRHATPDGSADLGRYSSDCSDARESNSAH